MITITNLLFLSCILGIISILMFFIEHKRANSACERADREYLWRLNAERKSETNNSVSLIKYVKYSINSKGKLDSKKELIEVMDSEGNMITLGFTNSSWEKAVKLGEKIKKDMKENKATILSY